MKIDELISLRLHNQRLSKTDFTNPAEVISWLGAVQAQDFLGSLWTVGQRMKKACEADIEKAIADRRIVRTWPMRGTLHFVMPENVRWMLKLLSARIITRAQTNYRLEGLDKATLTKSNKLIEKALRDGKMLMRDEVYDAVERGKITLGGQRGIHILVHAALEGLICVGPRKGKQHTFTLLDEWIPKGKDLSRDESLVELATIYFQSHGPATVHDFSWWTGLTIAESKLAIEMMKPKLISVSVDDQLFWMTEEASAAKLKKPHVALTSWFDEILIGYKDRSMIIDSSSSKFIQNPKNGIFSSNILIDGKVVGSWKRTLAKGKVEMELKPFRKFSAKENAAVNAAVKRYTAFVSPDSD